MDIDKSYDENKAILVDSENLKFLDSFLAEYFSIRKYSGTCNDGTNLEFATLEELLTYENPDFRKLVHISVSGSNDDSLKSQLLPEFKFELGSRHGSYTINYKLRSKNIQQVTHFETELKRRIKDFRPWYWILTIARLEIFTFIGIIVIFLWSGISSYIKRLNGQVIVEQPSTLTTSESYALIILALIIIGAVVFGLELLKGYVFPRRTILIGRQIKNHIIRNKGLKFIFGTVLLGWLLKWVYDMMQS